MKAKMIKARKMWLINLQEAGACAHATKTYAGDKPVFVLPGTRSEYAAMVEQMARAACSDYATTTNLIQWEYRQRAIAALKALNIKEPKA
jgi:hypothetical protein